MIKTLSPREVDVLNLYITGNNTKQIANILGLSRHTVFEYLKRVRIKFEVHTTQEAIAKAFQQGII